MIMSWIIASPLFSSYPKKSVVPDLDTRSNQIFSVAVLPVPLQFFRALAFCLSSAASNPFLSKLMFLTLNISSVKSSGNPNVS